MKIKNTVSGNKNTFVAGLEDFNIKVDGDEKGLFTGYGSTFGGTPDSYGDVITQGAFSKSLSEGGRNGTGIAMLWGHNPDRPVGRWTSLHEDEKGLKVQGKLSLGSRDGGDMFELMKDGAIQGLSIGFQTVDSSFDKEKGVRYINETKLWEISPVVFPANTRATITGIKNAIETAATPRELEQALRDSGVSGSASVYLVSKLKNVMFDEKKHDEKNIQVDDLLTGLRDTNRNISKILGD